MTSSIGALFGQSPIKPIQEHMRLVQTCVVRLGEFLEASYQEDWEQAGKLQQDIKQIESEADALKQEIRSNLPPMLLMPFARSDLIALLTMQDRLANRAKDVAGLMLGRRMVIPEPLANSFKAFFQISLDAATQAMGIIDELDVLLETGFRGKEVRFVNKLIDELGEIERSGDKAQITLRAELFALEDSLPPVNVMFLYRIIETIGGMSDIAKRVGSRLSLLLSR